MLEWLTNHAGQALTALSVLLAALTWYIGQSRTRRARIAAYTADAISSISTSERLAEADFQMTRLINAGELVDESAIPHETDRHIIALLDYYEYLCQLYVSGLVDKPTVR